MQAKSFTTANNIHQETGKNPLQKKQPFFQPKLTVNQPDDVYEKRS